MRLRTKIALAQLPLVVALIAAIAVASSVTRALGRGSQAILEDNYRSVLAAERMKEAAERVDSGLVFEQLGHVDQGAAQITANQKRFADELAAQEGNITEPGEGDATQKLHDAWERYRAAVARPGAPYFDELLPDFLAVKNAADVILAMNQDAMTGKSDRARALAQESNTLVIAVSIAGLVLGLAASSWLTVRLLRPLSVLGQTARRLGEGDLAVRARVERSDEIGALARELNTMAERVQKYRESSLGDLLEAQLAAQATIDSLPDPVIVAGMGGELRHANQAAEHVLGAAGALSSLDPTARDAAQRLLAHVAAGKGAYVPAGTNEAIAVGDRLLLPRAAPLYADEGDVAGVTIVFQDVTRLHRFEQLRDDLVATVAHELRTPLTSLRMAVHMLAENVVGELTVKQADLVFAAREDCDRLQAIVDELLDLSRIHADKLELDIAEADPEALVSDALDDQRAFAESRSVALHSEVLPDTPRVAVDRDRIAIVFANLLGNAIRYGGGEVTVRARATDDGKLRFEVADNGPGVPPDYRETIFDKYVRVPGAATGGSGLGLFIAREIVRAHGGEIGLAAGERGATFWFTVPVAAAQS